MAFVVQMHGEPGSGKSTLAREIGRRTGAVVLDKDVVKSAVMRGGIGGPAAGPMSYEVYWAVARSIALQGPSLIFDNPAYWPQVLERSQEIAGEAGAAYFMIECVCADRSELIERLSARDAMISQPRAPYRFELAAGIVEPSCERLVVDTTRPLDESVERALEYLAAGVRP